MSPALRCDLHMHSTLSDGTVPPRELARLCAEAGIGLAALTDHDTLAGSAEFAEEAERAGVTALLGVELTTVLPDGKTLHLLGYFGGGLERARAELEGVLARLRGSRERRNLAILEKLRALGHDISLEEVLARAGASGDDAPKPGKSVGRPHIAQVLVDRGVVGSIDEAFDKLLSRGRPAHVPRERFEVSQGLEMLARAGGAGVVAHPVHLGYDEPELERALGELRDQGLWGVEVRHSDHDDELQARYERLAARLGLGVTGGSDFHGAHKPDIALGRGKGALDLPLDLADGLRERLDALAA